MKKTLLSLVFCLVLGSLKTFANHDIGASLTYYWIGPNTYQVTYSHYSWNSGSGGVPNFFLTLKAPGCNAGRTSALQYQSTNYAGKVPQINASILPYYVATFTTIVTFTSAETACNDWVLSVGPTSPGQSAHNISGATLISIYTEALLKPGNNLNNSSPVFDFPLEPVFVANRYQPIVQSVGATDPDGDSLVYRMVAPLQNYNQPVTNYTAFGNQNLVNPNPQPPFSNSGNPQYAVLPGVSSYSPDYPILSYSANWASGQQNIQATKTFLLNPENGEVAFTPMLFNSGGINSYLVSYQVDEFRKINGIATKIGSVRRETIINVGNAGANSNPGVLNLKVNNAAVPLTTNFTISAGSTFTLQLDGADGNASDSVFLTSNTSIAFPGATFTTNSGFRQTGTFTWTPTAAHIRSQPYYLRVLVKDNAKPFAGIHVETFAIRVRNNGGVQGIRPDKNSGISLSAYPNPFQDQVTFKLKSNKNLKETTIIISNSLGQEVDRIALDQVTVGEQQLQWQKAPHFPAGQYVARLQSKELVQTIKFLKLQ